MPNRSIMNQNRELQSPAKAFLNGSFAQNVYMFLLFSLCPLLFYRPMLQTDTYWLINTGRYIVNHGFPHVEPFTMHQGLNLVVHQWLSTVIFYESYRIGGVAGVHILSMVTYALITFLIYRLALRLADDKRLIASYVTAFTGVSLFFYMVPRPQIFSLLIYIIEVSFLEYYIRNPKRQLQVVAVLPILSLLLINLHAAVWPVFFLLCIPYLIDSFKFKLGRIEGQGYCRKYLLLGFLLSIILGFINPYGYQAMTYLYHSYGNNYINSYILEMSSPKFKDPLGIFVFLLVSAVVLIYFLVRGTTRLRYVLITIGTLYMGLSSVRSFSIFIIFGLVFLSYYLKDINLSNSMPARRRALLVAIALSLMLMFRITTVLKAGPIEEDHKPETAVRYIKNNIDLSKLRLFNSFNAGGYIEFSGIRTFIDTRAEIFTKELNGKEDILKDFFDALTGSLYYADFAAKYSFTHFLVHIDSECLLYNYLKHDQKYKIVFQDKKYVLFEKIL
jgi:hypothetical protein